MITITALRWVPPFAQGYVKDLRVRWALEEAGLPYAVRPVSPEEQAAEAYRAVQPFGQVPSFEEDGLVLFESGAIVLHISERSEALLPQERGARARAVQWLIAALNSIEPYTSQLALLDGPFRDREWARLRRPELEAFVRRRIGELSRALGDKPWLDGERFTAADLIMATVLRELDETDIVLSDARLGPYLERCLQRPAFTRAVQAQIADYQAPA